MKNYLLSVVYYSDEKGLCINNAEVSARKMTMDVISKIREQLADELGVKNAREITVLNIMEVEE